MVLRFETNGLMVTANFSTANAAFSPDPEIEIAAIKARLSLKVLAGQTEGKVLDTNGNSVGTWKAK